VFLRTVHILVGPAIAVKKITGRYLIMTMQALPNQRFIRKTELDSNQYRKRFRQIDDDIIAAVTSPEADRVTPLMSKIYLRLANAPDDFWERKGVLRFEAQIREGNHVKAWSVLCGLLNVSSATANKALTWMHKEGIIGYFSGKNGVGLRIFLNRAVSSIGSKPAPASKRILEFGPASNGEGRASHNEAAFKDTYGDIEDSDLDINPCAPEGGADKEEAEKASSDERPEIARGTRAETMTTKAVPKHTREYGLPALDEIVRRIRSELEPALRSAAIQAAAREHERTREWLENRGLPKAARVAQREAFNVLRRNGVINNSAPRARAGLKVGWHDHAAYKPKQLTPDEINEVADICVSMLEGQGQAIDVTLAEISAEAGGYLLAEDAPKVRELAESLAHGRSQKG
jgi:hypothetical protein